VLLTGASVCPKAPSESSIVQRATAAWLANGHSRRKRREHADNLTRHAPLNPKAETDRPSPLPLRRRDNAVSRKGRGGIVGSSLANQGSGAVPLALTPCSPTMNLSGRAPLPALSPRCGERVWAKGRERGGSWEAGRWDFVRMAAVVSIRRTPDRRL
jgi:hypothetical protein